MDALMNTFRYTIHWHETHSLTTDMLIYVLSADEAIYNSHWTKTSIILKCGSIPERPRENLSLCRHYEGHALNVTLGPYQYPVIMNQGLYSLNGKTSYRQISWSLEAARLGVIMIVSLWNLTGISAALLPRCLLNFRAIGKVQTRISRLRDFTRSCGKTSYRLVNRGLSFRLT